MIKLSKGAMFGLEARAYKKQSGRLFLARLRRLSFRLVEVQQARRVQTAKGAMFGLDARIALAIFGALSVISGAALYSAIQQAQATALLTEMKEIGKAWESYYLDTGQNLQPKNADSSNEEFYILKSSQLVDSSSVNGWKGPYVSYKTSSDFLVHSKYSYIHVMRLTDDVDWSSWKNGKCTSGRDCFIWSMLNGIPNETIAKKIDEIVDSSDGEDKGNFRWRYTGAVGLYEYTFKIAPIANPND